MTNVILNSGYILAVLFTNYDRVIVSLLFSSEVTLEVGFQH